MFEDEEQLFEDEEEEFSTLNFNITLFQISKNWHLSTKLNLLESTEYTIHRNIERCLKKTVETKFEVGDKILMRNPTLSSGSIGGDPLVAPNVIAQIVEKVPGGMFKVILDDNSIHYQKAIYTGEMVLFEKSKDLKAESGERNEMRNKKALLDAISNFALDSRRLFYSRRPTSQSKVVENVQEKFNRLCEALDFGLLAQSDNDVVKKQEHQQKYMSIVDELSSGSFLYFMYGTVHWERKRKLS